VLSRKLQFFRSVVNDSVVHASAAQFVDKQLPQGISLYSDILCCTFMSTETNISTGQKARLTVFSEDHLPVLRTVRFWETFENTYDLLCNLNQTLDAMKRNIDDLATSKLGKALKQMGAVDDKFYSSRINSLIQGKVSTSGLDVALVFGRINVSSPGFWEVVGRWMPLDVIRRALIDAHERRKDRDYREDAEAEKLRLQNLILQAEAVQAWAKTLRDVGARDEDVQKIVSVWLTEPLTKLNMAARYFVKNVELEKEDGD